jgi:uncharacterized protein YbjQ (UPF0145 family)
MKNLIKITLIAATLVGVSLAQARDTVVNVPLADVLAMPEAKSKLDGSVGFYLSGQQTPVVLSRVGEDSSNKKTNAAGKSDLEACKWVALSVLIAFQNSAKSQGANAVVDMVSNYRNNPSSNPVTIECHAGAIMAGIAMKGTYAKVAK